MENNKPTIQEIAAIVEENIKYREDYEYSFYTGGCKIYWIDNQGDLTNIICKFIGLKVENTVMHIICNMEYSDGNKKIDSPLIARKIINAIYY